MNKDVHNDTEALFEDGSLPLQDDRREAFARGLFEGVEVSAAYQAAGFKRPRGNAQRMAREPAIRARVNFLRRELDEDDLSLRAVRRRQLRQKLLRIAEIDRLSLFEEVEFTKKVGRGRNAREIKLRRLQLKPLAELTAEQRDLVESLEGDGLRPAMPSKLGALAQLAKLDGLDQPARVSTDVTFEDKRGAPDLSDAELLAIVSARGKTGGNE